MMGKYPSDPFPNVLQKQAIFKTTGGYVGNSREACYICKIRPIKKDDFTKSCDKMLNTSKCNESSRKANFATYGFAYRELRVHVFPSLLDRNVYIVEKHRLSLSLATFHGLSKQKHF